MEELDNPLPESDDTSEEAVASPKKNKMLGLILGIVVVAGALGGGAYVAYSQYDSIAKTAATLVFWEDAEVEQDAPPEFGSFWEIENMIVNPAGTEGRRYLMINIGLESKDASVQQELEQKEIVIRDVLLKQLGQRTVEDLADVSQRSTLKDDLRLAVNEMLVGEVHRLYFTQYILQ